MFESTVIGAIVGAVSRLAPEVMRYLDRHLDRRHELAMQEIMLRFEEKRPDGYKYAELAASGQDTVAMLDALKSSWADQFKTGRAWLDAISILVRPGVTYALAILYITVKLAMLVAAWSGSMEWAAAYGDADLSFMSGIMSFWFLDRQMSKQR